MCSVGWIGAVVAYLALGVAVVTIQDTQAVRAAWIGHGRGTGWWAIVPLGPLAALPWPSLVMSLGTHWGLFRHYWVLIFARADHPLHRRPGPCTCRRSAPSQRLAQTPDGADLRALGGDLFHPGVGLVVLLAITCSTVQASWYHPVRVA